MLPIKKILCPVDFSGFSLEALENAREMAAHFDAQLCLLNVTQIIANIYTMAPYPEGIPVGISDYEKTVRSAAEQRLHEIANRPEFQGIEVRPLLRDGDPTDEIIGAAEEEQVDLIVIATHGLSGWRHLVFGSVAEKVIRLSTCPVLVTHIQKPQSE